MKFFIFLSLLMFSLITSGKSLESDVVNIGNKRTSDDVVLKFKDGGYIKKINNGAIVKSDDGINEKKIGSGSGAGGGENYNNAFSDEDNANAENGTDGWTASGGDFFSTASVTAWVTATSYTTGNKVVSNGAIYKANSNHTSDVFATDIANWDFVTNADALEGEQSFVWIPAAQDDTLDSPVLNFNKDNLKGRSCQSMFEYIGADENLSLILINGDDEELSIEELKTHTITSTESGYLLCPSDNAIKADSDKGNIRFRLKNVGATASAPIKFDKSYAGTLIGLTETTLPDVFSSTHNSVGAILTKSSNEIAGSSKLSSGRYQVDFLSGLSVPPSCNVSANSENVGRQCRVDTVSTSSVIIECEDNTDIAEDNPFHLKCQKQGADAKQSVQIYKSVPKVSENVNDFSARITGPATISSENIDWLSSCSRDGANILSCGFVSGSFSVIPSCTFVTEYGNSSNTTRAEIFTVSTTNVTVKTYFNEVLTSSIGGSLKCSKQGADFKTPTVQSVFVNQVQTSFKGGITSESCNIANNGTASVANTSGLCGGFLTSALRASAGVVDLVYNSSVFSEEPDCSVQSSVTNVACYIGGVTSTASQVVCTRTNTVAAEDVNFFVKCRGKR